MSCTDCTTARSIQWHGFTADCKGCIARSVARSPIAFEAKKEGRQTPAYRELLAKLGVTHDQVKAWQ